MAKKIPTALAELVHALEHHAEVVTAKSSSSKRLGRATAKVRRAATTYTDVVATRTGQPNPFVDFLDPETIESLRAERDRMANGKASQVD
ncbi:MULTISPECIES: hypothetical protein [unclassified Frigoribacterium]|uniref:hypothetical protein n=1 Tax=unclassified Frigoribacterium TaxID=2627005 RepID=UPI0006FF96C5|nr:MULTISPECIES: hypothetical protein [unclassified Frigoribacterium]KQO47703.1 hypothetical protein ASF07_09670 [Frigoribacterium sp. Leaf254]KQT39796.1 hypothetical protein ASG28_09675 [Frigoribacterium sp. Leaf415]